MKERATVIGAGIIGLATALEAQGAGFDVKIYTAEPPLNTTSAKAGAVFEPYKPGSTPVPEVRRFLNTGLKGYRSMVEQHGEEKTGVKIDGHDLYLTSYGDLTIEGDFPFLIGFNTECELITPDTGKFMPGKYKSAVLLHSVPTIDPLVALRFLQQQFVKNGGEFAPFRKIENMQDFIAHTPERVIFNAAGLSSQEMMPDVALGMEPMRGQILVADIVPDWDYSILCVDKDPVEYQFPRNGATILGGTTELGKGREVTTARELNRIFLAAQRVMPQLRWEHVIKSYAGIRPYSAAGAYIKREERTDGKIHIISTGFGGSGWTFAFGAAEKALSLVRPTEYPITA